MSQFIWMGILPACLIAFVLIVRRPARQFAEEIHLDHARELFRQQREWLEPRFLTALGKADPIEGIRWEEAQWHNEILWARDRQTRRLLAMIAVHFNASPFEDAGEPFTRHATALFEFRKGRWFAEGKRLDEVQPNELVGRNQRFEAVVLNRRG